MILDEVLDEDRGDLTEVMRHVNAFVSAIVSGEIDRAGTGLPPGQRWRPFEVGSSRWWWYLLVMFKPHSAL
jgi:hypothetical protein